MALRARLSGMALIETVNVGVAVGSIDFGRGDYAPASLTFANITSTINPQLNGDADQIYYVTGMVKATNGATNKQLRLIVSDALTGGTTMPGGGADDKSQVIWGNATSTTSAAGQWIITIIDGLGPALFDLFVYARRDSSAMIYSASASGKLNTGAPAGVFTNVSGGRSVIGAMNNAIRLTLTVDADTIDAGTRISIYRITGL